MNSKLIISAIFATVLTIGSSFPSRIDSGLRKFIEKNQVADILVSFPQNGHILHEKEQEFAKSERSVKITGMMDALIHESEIKQKKVSDFLKSSEIPFKSLWLSNQIYIQGANSLLLNTLEEFDDIVSIKQERIFQMPKFEIAPNTKAEWGVDKVRAEMAFELLRNSTDSIPETRVGVMSTGARVSHRVVEPSFLGDYGWYDPQGSWEPIDEFGMGTHEIGVIAGDLGVGVFPSAKWMACRSCGAGTGCGEYAILRCAEVMACPVFQNETMPDCSKAPHVVHADFWTGPGDDFFDYSLEFWEAAGIIPIFPVGGQGPECLSTVYPSDSTKVISVGGTNPDDTWYNRSSSGPTMSGSLKPEFVAPAVNIVSAWNFDDATIIPISATSCASSHVAGVVAMLRAYDPELTRTQALIALARGAMKDDLVVDEDKECGGIPSTTFPNNVVGFGRLDAYESLKYVIDNAFKH